MAMHPRCPLRLATQNFGDFVCRDQTSRSQQATDPLAGLALRSQAIRKINRTHARNLPGELAESWDF